jgi:hypothetical protein
MSELEQLQHWYRAHCDGDWEHQSGISITSLDNPGWSVTIDIAETVLAEAPFAEVRRERGDDDWIRCWVAEGQWRGVGDPLKLGLVLREFLTWARGHVEPRQ